MADDISVTVEGVDRLLASLTKAQSRALPVVEAVVAKGALNIKQDWARRWTGLRHAPALPRAISYDLYHLPGSVRAEIGPDKARRQGALGNIIEFGTPKNAPRPGGLPALQSEAPKTEAALARLAGDLLA
ncbi:MAG TPA: hypothetical protein VL652_34660 [Kutzneria sp.]|jgi:hypothetical protein|nr:hypothetical protein [Kutzneria sp.]